MRVRNTSVLLGSCFMAIGTALAGTGEIKLNSPDGTLTWTLSASDGKAWQSLNKQAVTVLEKGELGQVMDGQNTSEGIKGWTILNEAKGKKEQFATRGNHTQAQVSYNEYTVAGDDSNLVINVRMYNDGMAFRYGWSEDLGKKDEVRVNDEVTSFRFPADATLWTQDSAAALGPCEGVWAPSKIADFTAETKDEKEPRSYVRTAPITAELPGGGYAFIQEAGNFGLGWSGIKFALGDGQCKTIYFHDQNGFTVKPGGEQPWRVVLVTKDLNTLVNSDIIDSLPKSPDKALFPQGFNTSWVKPGRSSWTWWDSMSAKNDDQYRFVDMASEFGWEYHLVDEGWKKWDDNYQVCLDKMKELADHAAKKKVHLWAWMRWSEINDPKDDWQQMRTFITEMKKAGVVGLKVDFMDSASQDRLRFYDAVLVNTAKQQMMINFHGSNTPGGETKTWPHEMSREGIYGGEQNLWGTLGAEHLCALPFTRLVSGHGDFTGGYFGHGPKLRGSSWAMQMASNIIYTSPALHWVGNPVDNKAAFAEKSNERKLIEAIPSVWDQTIVLPGAQIGKYAPFARRSDKQWFVALINGTEERTDEISLSFLPSGRYKAVILSDLKDKNDGWDVKTKNVTNRDKIKMTMRPTGGGIIWLTPAR